MRRNIENRVVAFRLLRKERLRKMNSAIRIDVDGCLSVGFYLFGFTELVW